MKTKRTHNLVELSLKEIVQLARRYKTLKDFKKDNRAIYAHLVFKKKVLYVCKKAGLARRTPNHTMTFDRALSLAKRCKTRSEFIQKHKTAYRFVTKKGLQKELYTKANLSSIFKKDWTFEECQEEALKYKTKTEFFTNSPAYHAARRRNWIEQITSHMKTQGNFTLRKLYAFEHPDKSVYIGLTYNYERRYKAHMETSKILIAKHKVMGHRFVTFDTLYPAHEAALKEQELIENYRRAGWKILNKNKAGALGGNIKKWDFEKIQKLAKKYKTVKQFYTRQPSAAVIARRNGWMDKVCRHMISKAKRRYTDQELIRLAEQSGSRGKMRKLFNGAYQVALRRGVLDTVFPLSLKKQK